MILRTIRWLGVQIAVFGVSVAFMAEYLGMTPDEQRRHDADLRRAEQHKQMRRKAGLE